MTLEEHKYMPYFLTILVIAILLTVAAFSPPEKDKQTVRRAEYGDTAHVIYTGKFTDGTVFDTNDPSVNSWDDIYPKAPDYITKTDDQLKPLKFVIGQGSLLADFQSAVLDMKVGDRTTITIPPERGYGLTNEDLVITVDLIQFEPVFERMGIDEFNRSYGETYDRSRNAPPVNLSFEHRAYGWDVTVLAIGDDFTVTLMNAPTVGPLDAFPWEAEVINITSEDNGTILVEHSPKIGDRLADEYMATDPFAPDDPARSVGTVKAVTSETFTLDYNRSVVGQTLIFDIELVILG